MLRRRRADRRAVRGQPVQHLALGGEGPQCGLEEAAHDAAVVWLDRGLVDHRSRVLGHVHVRSDVGELLEDAQPEGLHPRRPQQRKRRRVDEPSRAVLHAAALLGLSQRSQRSWPRVPLPPLADLLDVGVVAPADQKHCEQRCRSVMSSGLAVAGVRVLDHSVLRRTEAAERLRGF
eukprot:6449135-Prymnesium_polylepis.1